MDKTEDPPEENILSAELPRSKELNLYLPVKVAHIVDEWYSDKDEHLKKCISKNHEQNKGLFSHDKKATNLSNAAGRNDPCPCGSGRKFKHCCELRQRIKNQKIVITNNLKKKNGLRNL